MNYQPIGWLRTPFKALDKMPFQPPGTGSACGRIELRPDLAEGLRALDGFSHVIVIYHFHCQTDVRLSVTPFLDDCVHGLFATRAPCRPNPIGLSVLRLCQSNGLILEVEGVDMLDETPLLDIKPYVPLFDHPRGEIQTGWLESSAAQVVTVRSDSRFGSND